MIVTEPRTAPNAWVGIDHDELINQVRVQALGLDWKVGEFERWVRFEGANMVAEAPVEIVGLPAPEDCAWGVGLENANNSRLGGIKVYAGLRLEDRNGAFAPMDVRSLGRHNRNLAMQLPQRVSETLFEAWGDRRCRGTLQQFARWKAWLEGQPLESTGGADAILMEAYRGGLMPWEKIGKVVQDFGVEQNPTAWGLLKCWTVVAGKCSPKARLRYGLRFFESLVERKRAA